MSHCGRRKLIKIILFLISWEREDTLWIWRQTMLHICRTRMLWKRIMVGMGCIEANPKYWLGLAGRKCQVVGAVLGHQTMEEIQFKYGSKSSGKNQGDPSDNGVMGGIVNPDFDNMEIDTLDDEVEPRFTVTIVDVFRRYHVPSLIDYLSLDVGGAEMYIMSSFPFDRHRIKIMTVERPKGDLIEFLQRNGYVLLSQLSHWGETLWCHESVKSTLDLSDMTFPRPRGKRTRTIKFNEPDTNELSW